MAANIASPTSRGDTPQEYFLASLTAQLSPSRAKARPGGMSPHRDTLLRRWMFSVECSMFNKKTVDLNC